MKTKILITGLSSTLMQVFAEKISNEQYEVIGLSRQPFASDGPFKWIKGGLKELASMKELLSEIEIIVHAAAITHTFYEEDYLELNLAQTIEMVTAANECGVKRMIYVSSRAATLNAGGYGKSKFLAEEYIKEHCKDWLIFKPSEIFGGAKNEGIETLISDVLKKPYAFYPANGEKMYPVDLKDTAAIMHYYSFVQDTSNQSIIINGKESFGYKELIKLIAQKANRTTIAIPIPRFVMYSVKYLLQITGLKIGIVPDQVDRFYAVKNHQELNYPFKSIGQYIDEKIEDSLKR
jgi:nucleoside-diphosphate-sugar epimerase